MQLDHCEIFYQTQHSRSWAWLYISEFYLMTLVEGSTAFPFAWSSSIYLSIFNCLIACLFSLSLSLTLIFDFSWSYFVVSSPVIISDGFANTCLVLPLIFWFDRIRSFPESDNLLWLSLAWWELGTLENPADFASKSILSSSSPILLPRTLTILLSSLILSSRKM